jgi:hypothetical protein
MFHRWYDLPTRRLASARRAAWNSVMPGSFCWVCFNACFVVCGQAVVSGVFGAQSWDER